MKPFFLLINLILVPYHITEAFACAGCKQGSGRHLEGFSYFNLLQQNSFPSIHQPQFGSFKPIDTACICRLRAAIRHSCRGGRAATGGAPCNRGSPILLLTSTAVRPVLRSWRGPSTGQRQPALLTHQVRFTLLFMPPLLLCCCCYCACCCCLAAAAIPALCTYIQVAHTFCCFFHVVHAP